MAATKLAVRRQPSGAADGIAFDYQPILEAQNFDGSLDTTYTGTVTAAGTGLSGTVAVAAVAGRIKWSDLALPGTNPVTLSFSAPGLTGCLADPITPVTPRYEELALLDGKLIELPRLEVDFTYPSTIGAQYTVGSGKMYSTIQAAYDAAVAANRSDAIELHIDPSNSVYAEHLVLKPKSNPGKIIFRRAGSHIVPRGTRALPFHFFGAPQVRIAVEDTRGVVQCNAGANHAIFCGIELYTPVPAGGTGTPILSVMYLAQLDAADKTDPATYPHHITIDRCYVHGGTGVELNKVVVFGGPFMGAIDSTIEDAFNLKPDGSGDTNAIASYYSTGPLTFLNNNLSAAGEISILGGSSPPLEDAIPSDVTFRGNLFTKDPAWKGVYKAKNHWESKNSRRTLVEKNILEHGWEEVDGQTGAAFVLKSVDQDAHAPWSCTSHLTIRFNTLRNFPVLAEISGHPEAADKPSPAAHSISIHNNVLAGLGSGVASSVDPIAVGGPTTPVQARAFLIFNNNTDSLGNRGSVDNLYIDHNTIAGATTQYKDFDFNPEGPPDKGQNFTARNNLFPAMQHLFFNSPTEGADSIAAQFTGAESVTNNVLPDPNGVQTGPAGNDFPPAASAIGYTDPSILDDTTTPDIDTILAALQLIPGSTYSATGTKPATDGTDRGADIPTLRAAMNGVYDGVPAAPPVLPLTYAPIVRD